MGSRSKLAPDMETLRPAWLTPDEWQRVVQQLHLAPQQAWIMSLILRDVGYDGMTREMGITQSTIRTYIDRIKARNNADTRMELIIKAFEAARPAGSRSA